MSCMMMNEKPLASLADYIAALLNYGYNNFGMEAPKSLYDSLRFCRDDYGYFIEQAIYDKLHDLNAMAYRGRYAGEHEDADGFPEYAPAPVHGRRECEDHHEKVMPWHYLIEKRLSFLIYQCTEDATRDTPLYKALLDLRHALDAFIVHNSSEWHVSGWGE